MSRSTLAIFMAAALLLGACENSPKPVDAARIERGPAREWLSHGRTYEEQRFSPLERITDKSVAFLGLAWFHDLESPRGAEATPLVSNGVIYVTEPWSVVLALDARNGLPIWRYDPQVPREKGYDACCDVVNRGVALWGDSVFVGALDGRLIALDAATGEVRWTTETFDPKTPRTITGAPRVVKGKVLIGFGGAEYGVRGYLSAYDADTGKLAWRFYTVPGDPCAPPDGAASDQVLEGKGAADLERRMVEVRRRRHGLGFDGLRPGARPALHRRRQWLALESPDPLRRQGRQPVPVIDRCVAPGDR